MSNRQGPPKHQNRYAWKPDAGRKINPTEVGGKLRPYSEISGVCPRCREQIDWKRRYGKYKPLNEPAKCQRCSKRAVRQAYHNLCSACAKEQKVCAKCCCHVGNTVGRDPEEVKAEQKTLEKAIKNSRERDRRSLLRAMNKGSSKSSSKPRPIDGVHEGEISVEEQKTDEDDNDDDSGNSGDENEEDNYCNDVNDDEYREEEDEAADEDGEANNERGDSLVEDIAEDEYEEKIAMKVGQKCVIRT